MKAFSKTLTGIVALIPSLAICAGTVPGNYPKDLLYKGKPIDTLCIYEAQNPNEAIPLASCGINSIGERKVVGQNRRMLAKGFIGYNYNVFTAGSKSAMPNAYSYYRILGNINGIYIISAINNSGGSGQFTAIYLLKREGDILHVSSVASGDRCNNGIADAQVKNQQLLFTTYITPYDFLTISNQNPYNLNGYHDLDSCATCCQAKISYQIITGQDSDNIKMLSIDIGDKVISTEGQSGYQVCFNRLIADYQSKGDRHLSPQQLDVLVHTFNEDCVRKDA